MATDEYGRSWIIDEAVDVLGGIGETITIRELHYQLVARGMPNTMQHYKRVVAAMTAARWDGRVDFDAFVDYERDTIGDAKAEPTDLDDEIEHGKYEVKAWMEHYHLNRWENQPNYVEVWIEKKAQIHVFEGPCDKKRVMLFPVKGYPSLTSLKEASERFEEAQDRGQESIIIYFGDYDPSGEDIPRSIEDNLYRLGISVTVDRILLLEDQVTEWGLPPAPTKRTDSRSRSWSGIGQVEMEAVSTDVKRKLCNDAIARYFDKDLHDELMERQSKERQQYRDALREYVLELSEEL